MKVFQQFMANIEPSFVHPGRLLTHGADAVVDQVTVFQHGASATGRQAVDNPAVLSFIKSFILFQSLMSF